MKEEHSECDNEENDAPIDNQVQIELTNMQEVGDGDDDVMDEEEQDRLHRNRTLMTVLHFVLTYPRWSLSLFLLLASRSLVMPTPNHAIERPLKALDIFVQQERTLYADCVKEAFSTPRIQRQINKTVVAELDRIGNIRHSNLQLLQNVQTDSGTCFNASRKARNALSVWYQTTGHLALWPNSTTNGTIINNQTLSTANSTVPDLHTQCTSGDRSHIAAVLNIPLDDSGNRTGDSGDKATSYLDVYRTSSHSSFQRVIDYAKDRSAYDYDYFVGVKIQGTLGQLQGMRVDMPDAFTLEQLGILDDLIALLQAILDALRDAYVRVDLLTVRLMEFHASINAFYVNYLDLYSRLSLASDFVQDFLPAGFPMPAYLDMSGIPIGEVLLPNIFELPKFNVDLPNIEDMLSEYIRQLVQLLAKALAELAETVAEHVREALEELLEELRKLLTLEDYNPPKYVGSHDGIDSPSEELEYTEQLGDEARKETLNAINHVSTSNVRTPEPVELDDDQPRNYTFESSPSLLENRSSTMFSYLEPRFPTFSIPGFIRGLFKWVFMYQWIIELVIQMLRLWRLRKRYERNATPDLPEIDFGEEDVHQKEEDRRQKASTMAVLQVTVLKHFMTPWMALGLILFPFAILGVTVWFPHVKRTCVHSRQGTVVARNLLAPMLINKANLPGNTLYAAKEIQCQNNLRRTCNVMFAESDFLYRQDSESLTAAQRRFEQSLDILVPFGRCVDTPFLDIEFEQHCCGLEGYGGIDGNCSLTLQQKELCPIDNTTFPPRSFRPMSEYLDIPVCSLHINSSSSATDLLRHGGRLPDSHFNCSVLEDLCTDAVPCSGADTNLIRSMAIEADCSVEVYIIKCCLLVLLALYHAIMVNLCSTLAFSSIKHLKWRSLKPDGIKFKTRVTSDGRLVRGDDRDERKGRIEAAMRRFELTGWVQLGLAIVIFFIWFISFFVLRHSLSDFNNV